MVFRGIFVDGKIITGSDLGLAQGTPVEFEIVGRPKRPSPARPKRPAQPRKGTKKAAARARAQAKSRLLTPGKQRRLSAEQRVAIVLKAAGGWADRPEWKGRSSADIAAELRRRLASRATHG